MPQYQNEYEGFGNALMNLGEKKREEERLRKEKEDERKYLAEQAEIEWQRRAPLAELKLATEAARQKSAEAQARLAESKTGAPTTQMLGNTARTSQRVQLPDGSWTTKTSDEVMSPLNQYPERQYAPKLVPLGAGDYGPAGTYSISADGTKTYVGAPPASAAKAATGGFTSAQELAARQKVIDARADRVKAMDTTKHPALDAIIAEREAVYNDIVNARKAPAAGAPSKATSTALMEAALTGLNAMKFGVSEEAAAVAGMEGQVPAQVVANTLAAQSGKPVKFRGTPSAPLFDAENMPAPAKLSVAEKNKAPAKEVPPFSDMVAAFVKQKKRQPDAKEEAALRKKYEAWLAANKE